MNKNLLLLLMLLFTGINGYCQSTVGNGFLPTYDPPSPEASALGKYIDHPVGYFTGTPEIKIPLFEIKTGRITVPINLSYHGSGIKVDEIASRVGIGWVLNAGGLVTRTVKTQPDETPFTGYFTNKGVDGLTIDARGQTSEHDLEPDVHYYNFGNKSGKIYFNAPTSPYALNKDPIKIDGPYNGNNRFMITTEDGLIYTFGAVENSTDLSSGNTNRYTSSWYLTKIYDPVTDKTVTFTYRTDMAGVLNYTYLQTISSILPCGTQGGTSANFLDTKVSDNQVLDRITYDEGYIEFKADYDRQDLLGDRAYTEINQYVNLDVPELKKGFNLNYTYTTSGGNNQENKRLYLESIQEKGSDKSLLSPYLFSYKNRDQLPARYSAQQDIWGYYNANNAPTTQTPDFPKVYVHSGGIGAPDYYFAFATPSNPAKSVISGVERSANPATVDYGVLNRVTYPTNGYTTYTYEIHEFDNNYLGGGIRIKEIDDYSASSQQVLSKKYTYVKGFLGGTYPQVAYPTSTGVMRFSQSQTVLGSSQGSYVGYEQVVEAQNSLDGVSNGTIDYIYTTDLDVGGDFAVILNNCRAISDLAGIRSSSPFPFFEMESREARRGVLIHKAYYDNLSHPIKLINYEYKLNSTQINVINSSHVDFDSNDFFNTIVNLRGTRFLNAEKMILTSVSEDDYIGAKTIDHVDPSISTTTRYTYTDTPYSGAFIRSETKFSSNSSTVQDGDDAITTVYQYPFDFAAGTSGGTMGNMVAMNDVSPVITKTTSRQVYSVIDNVINTYYTDAQVNTYGQNPNFSGANPLYAVVPAQVYKLNLLAKSDDPVTVTDPFHPGSLYEMRLQYLTFDGHSNPTSIIHDNQYELFEWSALGKLLSKTHSASPVANSSAQKTTYHYDWLQRLDSITDPATKLRLYEYDPFSRLTNIRDNNGNIISHNEYHFQQ